MKKEMEKNMNTAEVSAKLTELREKARKIRFAMAGSRPKNVKEERNIRRDIARLLTMQNAPKATK